MTVPAAGGDYALGRWRSHFKRVGHLLPLLKPGGNIALRETWRMAAGVLHYLKRDDEIGRRYNDHPAAQDLVAMLNEGRNCPPTSCAALLMATAANLLHLGAAHTSLQGMAEALEAAALDYFGSDYAPVSESHWAIDHEGRLDFYPLLAQLVNEQDSRRGAATFHACMISGATEWVSMACAASAARKVVLAGSCLQNRLLAAGLRDNLERRGFTVFTAQRILPDDASLALGQAWVALSSLRKA